MSDSTFFDNKLGNGLYSVPEISLILEMPQSKVRRYLNHFLNERIGKEIFGKEYSATIGKNKVVNFYVLMEFRAFCELKKLGISTQKIFKAYTAISKDLNVPFPFANRKLLTNGRAILYRYNDLILNADGTKQANLVEIVEALYEKIEFDDNSRAVRFFPRKDSSIIVDRHHQFGQPVIEGTNVCAKVVHSLYSAGDSVEMLSELYSLTSKQVNDAILFYAQAA